MMFPARQTIATGVASVSIGWAIIFGIGGGLVIFGIACIVWGLLEYPPDERQRR